MITNKMVFNKLHIKRIAMLATMAYVFVLASETSTFAVSTYSQAYAKGPNPLVDSDRDPSTGRDVHSTLSETAASADTDGAWAVASAFAEVTSSGVVKQTVKSKGYKINGSGLFAFARASARGTKFFIEGPPGEAVIDIVVPDPNDPRAAIRHIFDNKVPTTHVPTPQKLFADPTPSLIDPIANDLILNMAAEIQVGGRSQTKLSGTTRLSIDGLQANGDMLEVFEFRPGNDSAEAAVKPGGAVLGSLSVEILQSGRSEIIEYTNDVYFTSSNTLGPNGVPIPVNVDKLPGTIPINSELDLRDSQIGPGNEMGAGGAFTMILVPQERKYNVVLPEPSAIVLGLIAIVGLAIRRRRVQMP